VWTRREEEIGGWGMCFHISIEEEEALFLTHYLPMMMHWLCVFSSLIADLASPNGIYRKKTHEYE
jgi:hypothetical protein